MSVPVAVHFDEEAEQAVLGSIVIAADSQVVSGLLTRGLRPEHFFRDTHRAVFSAAVSLADRNADIDPITLSAEMERIGTAARVPRGEIEVLCSYVPVSGHRGAYADRVINLARWRGRERALGELAAASARRDGDAWSAAQVKLELALAGSRTESLSGSQWADVLWDYFTATEKEVAEYAVPTPFVRLTDALGGGLSPGESLALSGPTGHGKSVFADMWLDHAAKYGKRCHLYMTEMTAINRGLRYLARRTGVSFLRQRRRKDLTASETQRILAELQRIAYGCSVVADWDVEDIVRDALRARYDFVVIDLIHGFHYEDERDLDRLSKAVQRLARVSTTLDGFQGTAVVAVTHLKEEGIRKGRVPRPTISSIKGGSSIKQDCDFVCFVWQEQPEDGPPSGVGEIYLPKPRSGEYVSIPVQVNPGRFRFELREEDLMQSAADSAAVEAPF